jgi:hypothetical protein
MSRHTEPDVVSTQSTASVIEISSDDDLQGEWRAMESRVTNRRSLTVEEGRRKGKLGRINVKRTDEEIWLEAGVYRQDNDNDNDDDDSSRRR